MNIAVYTLTRDRLEYTKHCFTRLREKAGVPFDHFVVDNGSTDGTPEWIRYEYRPTWFLFNKTNVGISRGSNLALEAIFKHRPAYGLVIKMDNDCECVSENVIGQMVEVLTGRGSYSPWFALSPRVEGIVNQPKRVRYTMLAGRRIGLTAIIGGLFHAAPDRIYRRYRYPINLPLAHGQDDHFCKWLRQQGAEVGYVEGLEVNHYETTDGQALRYPEYFRRKQLEEKRRDSAEPTED